MPFNIRILDRDETGRTVAREATPAELEDLKRQSRLIGAAARAEEVFGPDELEYYTEVKRRGLK